MKQYFSKLILVVPLLFLGGLALAYTPPPAVAPAGNTDGVIDVGPTDQTKYGNLSVGSFVARGSALFRQNTTFLGTLRGDQNNNLNIGGVHEGTTYDVSLNASGNLRAKDYVNSTTLAHGQTDPKPICADASGKIIICGAQSSSAPIVKYASVKQDLNVSQVSYSNNPLMLVWLGSYTDLSQICLDRPADQDYTFLLKYNTINPSVSSPWTNVSGSNTLSVGTPATVLPPISLTIQKGNVCVEDQYSRSIPWLYNPNNVFVYTTQISLTRPVEGGSGACSKTDVSECYKPTYWPALPSLQECIKPVNNSLQITAPINICQ